VAVVVLVVVLWVVVVVMVVHTSTHNRHIDKLTFSCKYKKRGLTEACFVASVIKIAYHDPRTPKD
jgi:hypothetical protein